MSQMAFSTANWHWKNKNITPWAKTWFERELPTVSVEGEGSGPAGGRIQVTKVTECEGDVELGRRKSKLITIFDCRVVLKWEGTADDFEGPAEGTLTIPEVSHDVVIDGISDYDFQFALTSEASPTASALLQLARTKLPGALQATIARFPAAIIDTHASDLVVGGDPSRGGSPAPTAPSPAVEKKEEKVVTKEKKEKAVNTSQVSVEATFAASADDLYSIFTDEKRIPAWSRASAKSELKEGGEYVLFGGGVRGKYVSLAPGKELKQTWTLQSPTWPSGHEATLTTTFDQSTDSTKVTFTLSGVPKGMEDELKRNLEGY
ncbi:hypothetical protein PENSPDRAFT_577383 [Peniophora sp. CONT]|nr:hypothetical protein PENSPDRAFT_577383 [Peniophora sp. CONT]